jgi:DHA3 family macrolide efflux protein-like MFS transporter
MTKTNKNLIAFIMGQGLSTLSAFIVMYAIIWHVTLQSNSGSMLAIVTVAQTLPTFFIAPIAGALSDKYNRRIVAIVADTLVLITTLSLGIFLDLFNENMFLLLIVVVIRGFGQGFMQPVMMAIIPQITPKEHLVRVNGIMDMLMSVMMFASPAIAGVLLGLMTLGNILLIASIGTFIGIGFMFFFVTVQDTEKEEAASQPNNGELSENEPKGFFHEIKIGLSYVRKNKFVSKMVFMMFFFGFLTAPAANLGPLLIVRNWGNHPINLSISEMIFSVGMILGGLAIASWGGFKNRMKTFSIATVIIALQMIAFGLTYFTGLVSFFILFGLCGFTIPFFNTPAITSLQINTDSLYMGRVMSVMTMAMGLGQPLSSAIFGPLSDIININLLMSLCGIPLIFIGLYAFFNPTVQKGGEAVAEE